MKKRMALAALLVSGAAAFADCGWEFALGEGGTKWGQTTFAGGIS